MKGFWRIGLTLAGAAASAAAFAALWPHAREASALLLAQDDPAQLSDIQVNSALRTNAAAIGQGAAQALADNDADLAKSFTDLAQDKGIPLPSGLAARVDAAVTDENSTASTARRFATGFVTGEADDVASLSGT
ncbi:MAG TPA: hypothetical protein DCR50_07870, partial [Afipia sp.]|nr:hypothetical protein [Afipia sp.]